MSEGRTKICDSCGREFGWRKKWERDWDNVRYCSSACRRRGVTEEDERLEKAILDLLAKQDRASSICPSEAAKAVGGEGWRDLMEHARRAARRLAHEGRVEITQAGKPVDPSGFRGPIRLRLAR